MRDDLLRCSDMLQAIDNINQKCYGIHEDESTDLLNVWILHHLQIIGEAAYKTSLTFREQNPTIPWSKIIGTRHVLVHDYFQTNIHLLWQTIEEDLPSLKEQLEIIVKT